MRAPRLAALLLGLSAGLAVEAQSLFKCVGRDGKVVYQDAKCADDAKQSTVAPPSPPAPKARPEPAAAESEAAGKSGDAAKAGAPSASQQPEIPMETVVGILSNYQSCVEDAPGFSAKFDAAFQQWKRKNRIALARYDQDGPAQRQVRDSLEIERRNSREGNAEVRAAKAEMCEQSIGPLLGPAK